MLPKPRTQECPTQPTHATILQCAPLTRFRMPKSRCADIEFLLASDLLTAPFTLVAIIPFRGRSHSRHLYLPVESRWGSGGYAYALVHYHRTGRSISRFWYWAYLGHMMAFGIWLGFLHFAGAGDPFIRGRKETIGGSD